LKQLNYIYEKEKSFIYYKKININCPI